MHKFEFWEGNNLSQLGWNPNLRWSDYTGKYKQKQSTRANYSCGLALPTYWRCWSPRTGPKNEDTQIPGVKANQVDNIDLPGVDGEQNESSQTKIADTNQRRNLDWWSQHCVIWTKCNRTGSAQRIGNRTAYRSGNHRGTFGTNRIPDCTSTSDAETCSGHRWNPSEILKLHKGISQTVMLAKQREESNRNVGTTTTFLVIMRRSTLRSKI